VSKLSIPRPAVPSFPRTALTLSSLRGVRASGVRAGIKASGSPDVALLVADEPMNVAAVFTQNRFAAAPVVLSRAHLAESGGLSRAFVVNSGNANACTGKLGEEHAAAMCDEVARLVGCARREVLVCSTGVIGQHLPIDRVLSGIRAAHAELSGSPDAGRAFLSAIMTTDAFPKEAEGSIDVDGHRFGVAGVCKGAGMIEPDMATMLAFVGTDLPVSGDALRRAVGRIAARSFNAVHVDSHASTNDSFFVFSTGRGRAPVEEAAWLDPVSSVARRLAWLIARDGEGATKVTTIEVRGAESDDVARQVAKLVATSALVRTALYGRDPNWGRFVSQVGNSKLVRDVSRLTCTIEGVRVFERGEPTRFDRSDVSRRMGAEDVLLELDLAQGSGTASVMTSDLGYRYVEVNAEYTT
jgi:glutamate N-acetyltransferase/amino-acid N-acetyltransferase